MNRKLLLAGTGDNRNEALLYGGVALGLLAGAALSTYIWRIRVNAALDASPVEKADKMIDACEKKLERIEQLMRDLQEKA
jgi:hypothetical protein